jgi:hypothetical protein
LAVGAVAPLFNGARIAAVEAELMLNDRGSNCYRTPV